MRRTVEIHVPEPPEAERLYAEAFEAASAEPPDLADAHRRLLLAREAGSSEAAYAIGNWHGHGIHVDRDEGAAHALFLEAAEGNVPEALFNLAVTFEKGMLGRRDEFRAYRYYLRAALFGDVASAYEVFRCLEDGMGVARDREAAAVWRDAFVARGGDFEALEADRGRRGDGPTA